MVSRSWNPVELLKSLNWIGVAGLVLVVLALVLVGFLVKWVKAARKRRRYNGSYRRKKW